MNFLNIFEIILLSSLIGSVFALIILLTKKLLKNSLSPAFHYYIWLILLIKLVLPFGPQTTLNVSNMYNTFLIEKFTDDNKQKSQVSSSTQLKNSESQDTTLTNSFENTTIQNNLATIHINKLAFFIWLIGILVFLTPLIYGYIKLSKIVKTCVKSIAISHVRILNDCKKSLHLKTKVELLYSSEVSTPCLCGLISPKILIPVNVALNVTDEELRYILIHELTHLKNRDMFINWIINVLSIIYWFNPILLYVFKKIREDCETSCDYKVISYLDKNENIPYGNALIKVLELSLNRKRLMWTTSMVMHNSEIKRRITMISKYRKVKLRNVLIGVITLAILITLGIFLNTSQKKVKDITKETISNIETQTSIQKISSDYPSPSSPLTSDLVIYNSHPDEGYPSGINVIDVGAYINDKLNQEELDSKFLKNQLSMDYENAYANSRKLVEENVQNYSDTILLDIHRGASTSSDYQTTISFTLAQNNPNYKKNLVFLDKLIKSIKKNSDISPMIKTYKRGKDAFNQDLSDKALIVEIGNTYTSDEDIERCADALVN